MPLPSGDKTRSARPSMGPPTGGLGLYEDTEFIGRKMSGRPSMAAPAGMGLYEDTEFITGKMPAAGRPSAAGPGLGLYEDTEFITRKAPKAGAGLVAGRRQSAAAPTGGLGLYEDTEFITGQMPAPGRPSAAGPGMGLYEDTEFITRKMPKGRQQESTAGPGLGLYEDTEYVTRPTAAACTAGMQGAAAGGGRGLGRRPLAAMDSPMRPGAVQHDDEFEVAMQATPLRGQQQAMTPDKVSCKVLAAAGAPSTCMAVARCAAAQMLIIRLWHGTAHAAVRIALPRMA
jgi:hypothetical protein